VTAGVAEEADDGGCPRDRHSATIEQGVVQFDRFYGHATAFVAALIPVLQPGAVHC
jgi:hypothetical protein